MRGHPTRVEIEGLIGRCGQRSVFLGFASSRLLHAISFVDLLDEATSKGYQRRFNEKHSVDFRKYIQAGGSSTIPLTFNLRPARRSAWALVKGKEQRATLVIRSASDKVLAQVDCQHRLGHLHDLDVPLAFMAFVGLAVEEEMRIFTVINSKAKGLSSSLLDFNDARLAVDLGKEKPELLIAIHLNDHQESPWCKQLHLGGSSTSGIVRRASLRTIQKAVKRFLQRTGALKHHTAAEVADIVRHFWRAVAIAWDDEWRQPRKHLLTKGIGVYSLMNIAADLYTEASGQRMEYTQAYFLAALAEFADQFDWSTDGPLKGLGGESGVDKATMMLRDLRKRKKLKVVHRGR